MGDCFCIIVEVKMKFIELKPDVLMQQCTKCSCYFFSMVEKGSCEECENG
jgi:hypothetical protein